MAFLDGFHPGPELTQVVGSARLLAIIAALLKVFVSKLDIVLEVGGVLLKADTISFFRGRTRTLYLGAVGILGCPADLARPVIALRT